LNVTVSDCSELRKERIDELLRLELSTLVPAVAELPPLDVDFRCEGLRVRVTLKDSVTAKWVARDVVLSGAPQMDRERTLALGASELFLASWAELLLDKPEARPAIPDPGVVAAERAVQRAVPALASKAVVEIDLPAQGRVRHLSSPIPTLGAALRVGQTRPESWQLFATGGWEGGVATRWSGRVEVGAAEVGLGLRRGWGVGRLRLDLMGIASAAYVSLQGIPSSAATYGATHWGLTADLSATMEASVALRALRLGAALGGGYLAPGPVGVVDSGSPVRLDGPWLGATLFAGLAL
jgi:hypothetical protein